MKKLSIEYLNIDELIPYANNPRINTNAVDAVAGSIKEFGFKNPIIVDKENVIVAGHTRLLASRKIGLEEVPVIRAEDLTDKQIKAFRIADNKTSEFAEWDMELLGIEIEDISDIFTGFTDEELLRLTSNDNEAVEDDFDVELPDDPISKRGDIWELGGHRLMCGDSTTSSDTSVLMGGVKAHACWTDPPYNVSIGTIKHHKFKQREILNDSMSSDEFETFCEGFIEQIKENVLGCVYMAGPPGADGRTMFMAADKKLHCSTTIIWNKDQFTLGRGKYQSKYEPIWFGWVEDGTRFTDNRKLTNVWDIPRPKKSELHPTMKPLELITRSLEHSTLRTDIVLDLFGGSGSTLIACEQLDRVCYMMELDEKYVDVIVERYISFKDNKAEDVFLIRDGVRTNYNDITK